MGIVSSGKRQENLHPKGEEEEPTGQKHLISRPEPPPAGFLIQGKVVGHMAARFTREVDDVEESRVMIFAFRGSKVDDVEELRVRSPRSTAVRLGLALHSLSFCM